MNTKRKTVLSVDIGGSKIIVGIVDDMGSVLTNVKRPLPERYDAQFLMKEICDLITPFLSYRPVAVGVTIPGLADSEKGVWRYAPFSGIGELPVAERLKEKFSLPVYIENDVNACAIAEKAYGNAKEDENFLWMTVSNGIGGALFLNGTLFSGESGNAGEIGHFVVEERTDRRCGCGKIGCLEAMASGRGLAKTYEELSGKTADGKEIARLAEKGDGSALQAFEKTGGYIGKALSYPVNLLNISKIVIGGGVAESFPLLKGAIERALEKYRFCQAGIKPRIVKTDLGYHAALIGGAAVAWMKIK